MIIQRILVLILSYCILVPYSRSQDITEIQALGSELAKIQWEMDLQLQPELSEQYDYAVLKSGVVVFSPMSNSVIFYSFDGRPKWEKALPGAWSGVVASPDGECLYTYGLVGEQRCELNVECKWRVALAE